MFIILTVVSQVHIHVKTYQIVYLRYVQFINVSYNSKSGFLNIYTHSKPSEGFSLWALWQLVSTHLITMRPSDPFNSSPFFPQSWRTHHTIWACLSSAFLFILLLFPGKVTVKFGLTQLDSNLNCVKWSMTRPVPHLWNGDYGHLWTRCRGELKVQVTEVESMTALCKLK